jgi:hypothetical protein
MPIIPKIIADFSTTLAVKVAIGDTTATLQTNVDSDGVTLPDGLYYFTFDGNNSSKEHISCTKTGAALSVVKTVSRQAIETSGFLRPHRVGATIVMTDFAAYKAYMDNVAITGTVNASTSQNGVVQLATQAQVDAGTATGSTGAALVSPTTTVRSKLLSDYVVDTGTTNAYVITPSPAITAYTIGQIFSFKAASTNNGASTINVNGLGAKSIVKGVSSVLASADISTGQIVVVEYDGTNFQLISHITPPIIPAATVFKSGVLTRVAGSAITTQVIAHGLGITPKLVKITAYGGVNTAGQLALSFGTYDGTNYSMINGLAATVSTVTNQIVRIYNDTASPRYTSATVASLDATNITLTWGGFGGLPEASVYFIWEAQG